MTNDWYSRLVSLIEADSRDKKTISKAAELGPNFVSQMIKDGKRPNIENFMKLTSALGGASSYYVLTGNKIDTRDLELLHFLAAAPEGKRQALLALLRTEGDVSP